MHRLAFSSVRATSLALVFASLALCGGGLAQQSPDASQPIESVSRPLAKDAVSIGLVVDNSREMARHAGAVREAMSDFINRLRDGDELFIVTAREKATVHHDFSSDREALNESVHRIRAGGDSMLLQALQLGNQHLSRFAENDPRVLIVISATGDSAQALSAAALKEAAGQKAGPVYVIEVPGGNWRARAALQEFSQSTGGQMFVAAKGGEIAEMLDETATRLLGATSRPDEARGGRNGNRPKALAGYKVLIVRSIPVARTDHTTEYKGAANVLLERVLVSRLREEQIFDDVVDATDTKTAGDNLDFEGRPPGTYLELLGTVVEYRDVTRPKREILTWSGRRAGMKVQFLFRDAATGKTLLTAMTEGKTNVGLFRKSEEEVQTRSMIRVANQLIEQIESHR